MGQSFKQCIPISLTESFYAGNIRILLIEKASYRRNRYMTTPKPKDMTTQKPIYKTTLVSSISVSDNLPYAVKLMEVHTGTGVKCLLIETFSLRT